MSLFIDPRKTDKWIPASEQAKQKANPSYIPHSFTIRPLNELQVTMRMDRSRGPEGQTLLGTFVALTLRYGLVGFTKGSDELPSSFPTNLFEKDGDKGPTQDLLDAMSPSLRTEGSNAINAITDPPVELGKD